MVAPIAAVGSMMVRGVFKSGGLLTGLGSMVGKLKDTQQKSKSTSTEMKRMTGHAHLLRNALAMIGVGGFSALLMQTPALAGGLAKIKTEMMLMANIVGRALKPSLDAVATILQGIRTGDWSKVKAGVIDLVTEVGILALAVGGIVVDFIWGEGTGTKMLEALKKWGEELHTAWDDNDLGKFLVTLVFTPLKWVWDGLLNFFGNLRDEVDRIIKDTAATVLTEGAGQAIRDIPIIGKLWGFAGYNRARDQLEDARREQGIASKPVYDFTNDQTLEDMLETRRRTNAEAGVPTYGFGGSGGSGETIGTQTNNFNIDMQGVTGDLEDPSVMNKIYDLFTRALSDRQGTVAI